MTDRSESAPPAASGRRRRWLRWGVPFLMVLLVPLALSLGSCRTPALGVVDGSLTDCPGTPNCVASEASDPEFRIEPFALSDDPAADWTRLLEVVEAHPRTTIIAREPEYLRAVCRSPILRFADDLEFLLDRAAGVIHVRSASRIGHSDLGVNRDRVAVLREAYEAARPR